MDETVVRYRVAWPEPHAHRFHVEASFEAPLPEVLELELPVWNPGSYLVREFARHVRGFQAWSLDGTALPARKTGKATWSVTGAAAGVRVRYEVFAHELSVRTSHLDDTHAFWNGVTLFVYAQETRFRPALLEIEVPSGWKVATTLERVADATDAWRADDYDHLVDCPVEVGAHRDVRFEVDGIPHEIAVWGDGNVDLEGLRRDLATLVAAARDTMGGLPYRRYLFVVHLAEKRGGGLEHRDSCVLHYPRFGFRPRRTYEEFLDLASHELFHVWNVKRIRPTRFAPYDYARECITDLLWVMEGVTDYYAPLLLRRAGLIGPERYLEMLGENLTQLGRTPGRAVHSLEEVSRDAWIRLYRPDEDTPNTSVSYYLKGHVVASLLDLEIRARSRDRASLDTVLRELAADAARGETIPEGGFGELVRRFTGVDVEDLLDRYVRSTEELDVARHLALAGLVARTRPRENAEDRGGRPPVAPAPGERDPANRPQLGASFREEGGRLRVALVTNGSPAERAGLYAGDEVVAVGGWRVHDVRALEARLDDLALGASVALTAFRRERLTELTVTPTARPLDTWWIEADSNATAEQCARYRAWLGELHPAARGGTR
ncbi:MAG: PDZ domain-containing protein [bacterium]